MLGYESDADTWDVRVDGVHRERIIDTLIDDDFTEQSAKHILQSSAAILGKCPNPLDNETVHRKGLIYGRVQSGKTANFLSLIALSFDNGYRIAVILGGNTDDLTKQNGERAKQYFANSRDVTVLCSITDEISYDTIRSLYNSKQYVVIVTIKTPAGISKIQECVGNDKFPESPLLIIDDEGDQATPNTLASKGEFSSTYRSAMGFANSCNRSCFLSVTATPQANLLISVLDELSPDFVRLIYPGDSYCGLSTFHNPADSRYLREIPVGDADTLLSSEGIPGSLVDALADFFVGAAVRSFRGDSGKHSMLIHPSGYNIDHELVKTKVELKLKKWNRISKTYIESGGEELDPSHPRLLRILEKSYSRLSTTCTTLPSFDLLIPEVLDRIYCCKTTPLVFNGKTDTKERKLTTQMNIVVGGNLLQRGITIPGLAISYMPRSPKKTGNVDTIEQRARWFGYKSDYLDVCRVYLTLQSIYNFENIYEHDENLWSWAEKRVELDDLKTVPRVMRLQGQMIPTRKNVSKTHPLTLNSWYTTNHLNLQQKDAENNIVVVESFRNAHNDGKLIEFGSGQAEKHFCVRDIEWNIVTKEILNKIRFNQLSRLTEDTITQITDAFDLVKIRPLVDIMWMREGYRSVRTIQSDGSFGGLHTGRSNNYPGEQNLTIGTGKNIQLQLFYLHDIHNDYPGQYLAVAIKIPSNIQESLVGLITNGDGL